MTETTERVWTQEGRPRLNRRGLTAPPGPWWDEPDKVQWIDPATGLDCLAVRGPFGAWCGYVGVPPGHPLHGADYLDVDVDVHGGLTFAGSCRDDAPEESGICHVPFEGRPAHVWWLGFDCSHCDDYAPGLLVFPGETYRDLGYVRDQVATLAGQLA
jgi:hypothetical protein